MPDMDLRDMDLRARLAARLPTTVRNGRIAVSRGAAAGIVVVSLAAVALAGSYAWRARSTEAVLPAAPSMATLDPSSPGPGQAPTAAVSPTASGQVVVDVAGRVVRPGVLTLPLGSRVVDAIDAAGGAKAGVNLTSLNLARLLVDGEQILVGTPGPAAPAGPGGVGGAGADPGGGLVDLNSATLEQLDTLPGVGPVLAQRILDWRTAHGRFSSIDELREVSGIGDARLADIAPHVRV